MNMKKLVKENLNEYFDDEFQKDYEETLDTASIVSDKTKSEIPFNLGRERHILFLESKIGYYQYKIDTYRKYIKLYEKAQTQTSKEYSKKEMEREINNFEKDIKYLRKDIEETEKVLERYKTNYSISIT